LILAIADENCYLMYNKKKREKEKKERESEGNFLRTLLREFDSSMALLRYLRIMIAMLIRVARGDYCQLAAGRGGRRKIATRSVLRASMNTAEQSDGEQPSQ